ncbi:MAG: hypothetical protein V7742_02985 [Halioglobus sp.]
MLTMTPTANLEHSQLDGIEVFAVIEGRKVFLPDDAKYVMQDRRGIWFYAARKPRPTEGDWTPNKTSIACLTDKGTVRAMQTETNMPWLDTCQRTVRVVARNSGRLPSEDEIVRQ